MSRPFSSLTPLVRRFQRLSPRTIDAVIGTCFTVLGLVGLFTTSVVRHHFREPDAFAVFLALGCTLPFFARRRAPLATLLVSTAFLVVLATMEFPYGLHAQMLLVGAYTVGSWCEGRKGAIGLGGLLLGVAVVAAIGLPDANTGNVLLVGGTYVTAYLLGLATRNRRLYLQQLEERTAILEHERDEEAKRAVADERLRIAQELHDVVAHSMGVIAVQAGVGAHVIDDDPAEAKRSLEAIATTSRGTLAEIRRLLGVLRAREGDTATYQPAPGLGDLDRLVGDVTAAGVPVDVQVRGGRCDLPAGVDLTAYRIVQEALTNVLKHAGPAHATVTIGYEPSVLRLEIMDDGRGVNGRSNDGGNGLLGMRERVGVYGGSLEAGPRVGGGFRVAVVLPYGEPE
ncbi:MAG: sensor histidine kinase [Acidimicrobiia bacterium]